MAILMLAMDVHVHLGCSLVATDPHGLVSTEGLGLDVLHLLVWLLPG